MADLFAHLHMEDRTSDFPEGTLITEGDEGESVAAAIAEVTEEEAGVVEAEREMDNFVDDAETASDLVDAVAEAPKTESAGLTQTNARLLAKVLRKVGGPSYVGHVMPKMEHFDGRANRRDATSLVMESVSDSLKGFWEALKKQFAKAWNALKGWYVKAFSAARKIADRAKSIRDRAESASSTIDKKTFAFGQIKQLAVNGKLKTVSEFEAAFGAVVSLVNDVNEAPTDKAIEALRDDLDKLETENAAAAAIQFNDTVTKLVDDFKSTAAGGNVEDAKILASLGAGAAGDAQVSATPVLPGDKQFVVITAKDGNDFNKVLRMTRLTMVNAKDKQREIPAGEEVVTLNSSQVAKLASAIAESAETIYDYEKKFSNVEKAQEGVIRKLDELFRVTETAAKEDGNSSEKGLRDMRTTASNATALVRRLGGAAGQVNSYAVTVFGATLNWCEGSMRNYKQ